MNLPRCWRLRQARKLRRLRAEVAPIEARLRAFTRRLTPEARHDLARMAVERGARWARCPTCGRPPWDPIGWTGLCTHKLHGPWL